MITPIILGRGRAGLALAKSLANLNLLQPNLGIAAPVWLNRSASLCDAAKNFEKPVLCISNPPGLHARAIIEADRCGYAAILCEKPACVNLEEVNQLRGVKTPTAILHVYRQMWGLQTLKKMIASGELGKIVTIEGRYWQASTAAGSLDKQTAAGSLEQLATATSWKNDPELSGEFDTFLDTGTHWIDAVSFLFGEVPDEIRGWRSFANSDAAHRDSHVQVTLHFKTGARAFGSISKNYHGADNHFELNVIGTKLSATWEFLKPDQIVIGEGRDLRILTRKTSELGSQQSPFHAQGWLEGYIEIAAQLFGEVFAGQEVSYPTLKSNLDILSAMFATKWEI